MFETKKDDNKEKTCKDVVNGMVFSKNKKTGRSLFKDDKAPLKLKFVDGDDNGLPLSVYNGNELLPNLFYDLYKTDRPSHQERYQYHQDNSSQDDDDEDEDDEDDEDEDEYDVVKVYREHIGKSAQVKREWFDFLYDHLPNNSWIKASTLYRQDKKDSQSTVHLNEVGEENDDKQGRGVFLLIKKRDGVYWVKKR